MGTSIRDGCGDAELVAAALAGSKDAFAFLIDRHRPMVCALAARLLNSTAEAEDAAQEAAISALVGLERLRSPERFGAWYAGIALNVARRWLRDPMDTAGLSDDWPDSCPPPDEIAEAQELAHRVRRAVEGLAPGQRQAVLVFYWAGLTHAEAAAEFGISPGAVKARLHQARAALFSELAPHILDEKEVLAMPSKTEQTWIAVDVEEVRRSDGEDRARRAHVIVLKEREGDRELPIYVGAPEATALACTLEGMEMPRPMTYTMAAKLTEAAGSRVTEVRITRLAGSMFYAVVRIDGQAGQAEVDVRPSDALNLALVCGAPIRVDESIFESEGPFRRPDWRTAWREFPTGASQIAVEVRQRQAELSALLEANDPASGGE